MKTNLDAYERQMERSAGQFRPVSKKKAQRIEGILQRAKKSRNITSVLKLHLNQRPGPRSRPH